MHHGNEIQFIEAVKYNRDRMKQDRQFYVARVV